MHTHTHTQAHNTHTHTRTHTTNTHAHTHTQRDATRRDAAPPQAPSATTRASQCLGPTAPTSALRAAACWAPPGARLQGGEPGPPCIWAAAQRRVGSQSCCAHARAHIHSCVFTHTHLRMHTYTHTNTCKQPTKPRPARAATPLHTASLALPASKPPRTRLELHDCELANVNSVSWLEARCFPFWGGVRCRDWGAHVPCQAPYMADLQSPTHAHPHRKHTHKHSHKCFLPIHVQRHVLVAGSPHVLAHPLLTRANPLLAGLRSAAGRHGVAGDAALPRAKQLHRH